MTRLVRLWFTVAVILFVSSPPVNAAAYMPWTLAVGSPDGLRFVEHFWTEGECRARGKQYTIAQSPHDCRAEYCRVHTYCISLPEAAN